MYIAWMNDIGEPSAHMCNYRCYRANLIQNPYGGSNLKHTGCDNEIFHKQYKYVTDGLDSPPVFPNCKYSTDKGKH